MPGPRSLESLPNEAIDEIVMNIVSFGMANGGRESHEQAIKNVRLTSMWLNKACSLPSVARYLLSHPMKLRESNKVPLMQYLRLSGSGSYEPTIKTFKGAVAAYFNSGRPLKEDEKISKVQLHTLCGRLFSQIGEYKHAEEEFDESLSIIEELDGGTSSALIANRLEALGLMLRGLCSSDSAFERRKEMAKTGLKYSLECLRIRKELSEEDGGSSVEIAAALHCVGYHSAEYMPLRGQHSKSFGEQALAALHSSATRFLEAGDYEMYSTCTQDTGLAFYYQRKWGEAFQHYVRACRVIVAKFGNKHVDLGAPIFNVGNMLSESEFSVQAIRFYRLAYSIYQDSLGCNHSWTQTAKNRMHEALDEVRGEVSRNKRVIEEEEGIVEGEEGEWDSESPSKRCEAYQTAVAMGKMVDMIEESLRDDGNPGQIQHVPLDDIETLLADVEENPPQLEDHSWSDGDDEGDPDDEDEERAVEDDEQLVAAVQAELTGWSV